MTSLAEPAGPGYEVRLVAPDDQPALESFLLAHADSSLFLRSFLSREGLVDEGQPLQGTYAAAFRDGEVVGVAMHASAGWVVLQAPEATVAVARHAVGATQRTIVAVVGPCSQAEAVRMGLGLSDRKLQKHSCEDLFDLDLSDLITPPQLASERVLCCRAETGDQSAVINLAVTPLHPVGEPHDLPLRKREDASYSTRSVCERTIYSLQPSIPL